jgi:hypothetical protein
MLTQTYSAQIFNIDNQVDLSFLFYSLIDSKPLNVREYGRSWVFKEKKSRYLDDLDICYLTFICKEVVVKESDVKKRKKDLYQQAILKNGFPNKWWRKREYRDDRYTIEAQARKECLLTSPIKEKEVTFFISTKDNLFASSIIRKDYNYSFMLYLKQYLGIDIELSCLTYCFFDEENKTYQRADILNSLFFLLSDSPDMKDEKVSITFKSRENLIKSEKIDYRGSFSKLDNFVYEGMAEEKFEVDSISFNPQLMKMSEQISKIKLSQSSLGVDGVKDRSFVKYDDDEGLDEMDSIIYSGMVERFKILIELLDNLKERVG